MWEGVDEADDGKVPWYGAVSVWVNIIRFVHSTSLPGDLGLTRLRQYSGEGPCLMYYTLFIVLAV